MVCGLSIALKIFYIIFTSTRPIKLAIECIKQKTIFLKFGVEKKKNNCCVNGGGYMEKKELRATHCILHNHTLTN